GTRVDHEIAAGPIADYPAFRAATFRPRPADPPVHDLKVWLHHVTFTGDSFPLQARASVAAAGTDEPVTLDVGITTTQVVTVLAGGEVTVRVEMADQDREPAAPAPSLSRP
ncbi:MAG TPA: hypothetical protein VF244_05560, partial [Acidimicrobiales bacterium]